MNPEGVGSAVAEVVAPAIEGAGAQVGEAVDTASQTLAATIANVEATQGAGAAMEGLAQGAVGDKVPENVVPIREGVVPEAQTQEQIDAAKDNKDEGDESADGPKTGSEASKTADTASEQPDEVANAEAEETARTEDLASKVENVNARVNALTEQMKAMQNEQDALKGDILNIIAEMPGLEDIFKAIMEKATPEEKKKIGLLGTLLKMLTLLISGSMQEMAKPQVPEQQKQAT